MSGSIALTACERLRQADQAYHDLMRGGQVRSVTDENGESISYTVGSRSSLLSYIQMLQLQCPDYVATALTPPTRPMRFWF